MSFLDIAKSRYTTKTYNQNEKISEEKINKLKEIIRLSPSSLNSQPWKFSFVSDEKIKEELAEASYFNAQRIKEASHLVVFSAIDDLEILENQFTANLPEGALEYYNQLLKPKGEEEIMSWVKHQVYISLGFFLSACATLDIDSTPMEGIEADKYKKILELDGYKALFAVAIGYRNEEDENQPSKNPKTRLALDQIIQSV